MKALRLLMLSAVALAATLLGGDSTNASSPPNPAGFDVNYGGKFCLTAEFGNCLKVTSFSVRGNIELRSQIPLGDANAGIEAWAFGVGSSVRAGADIKLGARLGYLDALESVGLTNGPLVSLSYRTSIFNASTDNSTGNLIYPLSQSSAGSGGTLAEFRSDTGGGSPANGLPAGVDRYPSFINEFLTPDGGIAVVPFARYVASVIVGGESRILNILTFQPGALAAAFPAPHPFADLAESFGYTMLTLWGDPIGLRSPTAPSIFTTFKEMIFRLWGESRDNPCTGSLSCSEGCMNHAAAPSCPVNDQPGGSCSGTDEGGCERFLTPSTLGTHLFYGFAESLRDADGDGIYNALDLCPLSPDIYDPWSPSGDQAHDQDLDRIPDNCDPSVGTDDGPANRDNDTAPNGMEWLNAADNCPLIANGTQINSEGSLANSYVAAAPRGGPKTDEIGDACDVDDIRADGRFDSVLTPLPICVGGTDSDDDGWCSVAGAGMPADPNDANPNVTPEDYDIFVPMSLVHSGSGATPPMRQPVQVCNDGIDNDGDTLIDLADNAAGSSTCRPKNMQAHPGAIPCGTLGCSADTDGDGFTDEAEILIGTDALGRCGVGAVPDTSTDWPLDFRSAFASLDAIKLDDLTSFLAPIRYLDKSPPDALYDPRHDLVPGPSVAVNPWVQLNDLTALIAGVTGLPPMTGGVKAFHGAVCTAHPTYGD